MSVHQKPETLLHRLREHASRRPDALAFSWLNDAGAQTETLTYVQLARRVDAIAAHLREATRLGDRALLLYGPGLEFVSAFLGCLAAGVIAVPAYPPRNRRHHARLDAIVHDAEPQVVLVGDVGSAKVDEWLSTLLLTLRRIDTIDVVAADAIPGSGVLPVGSDLALLQYTSGSTSTPKGVMVTHANIVHNSECLRTSFHLGPHSVGVCWLPSFHDMGLIDGVLQPLYTGFPAHLMAPSTFIQRPATWLEAITRYGGTHCGGPNFAYEACLLGVTDAQKATLDLRAWETAYNGAEPVRRETQDAFAKAFAQCGFHPRQFYPCYGLAESTLIVTGSEVTGDPVYFAADADALERHEVRPAADPSSPQARYLVGCGTPVDGLQIAIVDPETRERRDGRVGEIWVAGPSVAAGYWRRDEATVETFQAMTAEGDGPFMRTGDLGLLHEGELFVTGRIKDLVIIRGRNHYPQDIEATASASHPTLARGLASCFSVDEGDQERLVLVQEVPRTQARSMAPDDVLQAMRAAIVDAHEIDPWDIVLVPALSLPKTSSGKLQRGETRRRYLADEFKVVARLKMDAAPTAVVAQAPPLVDSSNRSNHSNHSRAGITAWVVQALARTLQTSAAAIDPSKPFANLGVDSLAATRLAGALQDWLGRSVSPTLVYDYPTIDALAAHLSGEQLAAAAPSRVPSAEPIAIVGIGCRFPGARGPEAFWNLLRDGVDAVAPVPQGRWRDDLYHPEPGTRGRHYSPRGGFLDAVDSFDAGFFDISPNEADRMDPQQRILLETTWEAFEDAGMAMSSLAGTDTGVFVGVSTSDYRTLQFGSPEWLDHHAGTGNAASIAANRISYLFDLQGPSLAVDTACSSSLLAVHLASESVRQGECGVAVAGGVNLMLTPDLTVAFSQARMLSPEGKCKAFDAGADGYVRGEGCGMVVLKRLSDAVRDGDPIVAVIRASAVNQDGRTNGLTAPNGVSQQRVIRQALSRAGVDPTAVQYVEAHGTGTPLGDPIEMHAIRAVYGEGRTVDQPLYVGSVKTNIGHLEAAAGVASLIKTAMALRARTVVPHLHFSQWNPEIALDGTPIDVPRVVTAWPVATTPMAAVSAFGFGGTNVHMVLEAAPAVPAPADTTGEVVPLLLSARTPAALRLTVERFRDRLAASTEVIDVAFTAATGRDRFAVRMGVSGRTTADLVQSLEKWLARPVVTESGSREGARVAWFFTGQGSQYSGMASELYRHDVSRDVIDRLTTQLKDTHGIDMLSALLTSCPEGDAALARTSVTQPALYVVQCALSALWQSRGVEPAAVIGHSVGEFAAAWVAGVFSLEDGLDLIATRGRLMDTLGQPGGMVAVSADIDRATSLAADLQVEVAALNAATQIVMAGPHADIDTFMARCEADDVTATRLVTSHAFHSALIEPALPGLVEAAASVRHHAPRLPWISNLTGAAMAAAPTPDYWRDHARQTVRFEHGVRALEALGITAGLEIGPSPVLIGLARRTAGSRRAWIASLDRRRPAEEVLADAVVALHTAGANLDGQALFPQARRVSLPTYPFATERHWFETPGEPESRPSLTRTTDAKFYDVAWQSRPFPTPATGPDLEILRAHLSVFEPALRAHTQTANLPDALQALDSVALDWAHAAIAGLAAGARLPGRPQAKGLEDGDIDLWNTRLGIAPRHHRLATRLLRWLVAHDRIVRAEDGWRIIVAPNPVEAATRTVTDFPEVRSEGELLSRCGPRLGEVLRGELDPLHVLFPGGDFAAAAAIYTEAPAAQLLNGQVAAALATYLSMRDKTERIRLLELGAGTGGLTTYLLPVLAAWGGDYEYVFTDLSPSFLEQAKAKFSAYRGVEYRLLDLESLDREPTASYDIALAANAVHAVAKLAPVLRGLRGVLRPSGQLWLLEGIRAQGWLDLTFGLTEGWWKAADGDGRSSYPLLPVDRWCRMLADAGFEGASELSLSTEVAPYALIGAARPHHANTDTTTRWILAGRRSALRDALHSGLSNRRVVDVPVDHLGEALAAEHTNDTSRTHVVLCLDDVLSDGGHPDQAEADAVSVSAVYLDALRTIVRHTNTRVSVVTRGARPHPAPGERDVARLSAASVLWGLGKTTSLECPDHWGGIIDLDPAGDPDRDARRVIDELTDARAEDQQVWRGGVRWVPRLRARAVAASASGWPQARGSVLVTGGTGAMGVQTVAGLARAGYRHFVLLSRRGHLADEAAALLNSVRALGAVVHLVQGDAATAADVARALETIERDGQALQGIIHAAGVAHAESLALSTREDLERVYRAKIQAPLVLQAMTQDRGLDFFVVFSSMVSLWGAKGQAVYAAGNHFLDDWAVVARQQGVPARAINWGPVSGGGMVPAAELAKVATLGVRALPIESIPRLLAQAMTVPSGHVAVLDVTWEVFRAHFESRAARPFFDSTRMPASLAPSAHIQGSDDLRDVVRREVAAVLGHTDPTAIDTERGFFDIGLDSLTIVQLKTRLEESLGLTLPSTLGLEYPSIDALTAHITSLMATTPAAVASPRAVAVSRSGDEPIAIVGIGCRFPGGASDPASFWNVLRDRVDAVRPFPSHRWRDVPPFSADTDEPGTIATRMGGFLDHIDQFDADFFRLSAREASSLDPQHRLLLQVAWDALEDAGSVYARSAGARVGVFAGVSASDYARRLTTPDAYYATGNALNAAPGRISYLFGFRGPSIAIDTACSSSLVAIRLACQSLRSGECDAALAGGVNLILSMETTQSLSRAKVLSPEGRCRAFDAAADGMARAEGCGLVMLKPLSKAREDGDRIYAVIRAAGVNQDGASGGFTVPSRDAQEDLMRRTLAAAGVQASAVDYVEAHGTGTPLGDPIEVRALASVYSEARPADRPLRIGSVKTNLGHTESASGVAGIIKTALALWHEEIPPQLHFSTPSPHIDWDQMPIRVVTERTAWPSAIKISRQGRPRLAGVSSFGLSGTNAHVLLEEAPPVSDRAVSALPAEGFPIVVSASSEAALLERRQALAAMLTAEPDEAFVDVAYTLSARRAHLSHRFAAVCVNRQAAIASLEGTGVQPRPSDDMPANESERIVAEYQRGAVIDWAAWWRGREGRVVSLPRYPFQARSFWIDLPMATPLAVTPGPLALRTPEPEVIPMSDLSTVRSEVVRLVADLLQESPSTIDVHRPFLEMGADSIILTEAVKGVERRFGVVVAIRQMFESLTTIDALAHYIVANGGTVQTPTTPTTPELRNLGTSIQSSWNDVFAQQFQQASQVLTQLAQQQLAFLATHGGGSAPTPAAPPPVVPAPASPSAAGPSSFWKQSAPERATLTRRQQAHLDALIARYVAKTLGSKNSETADKPVFADMRTAIGFRLETKEVSYPIVAMRSEGARFWDVDGNEYVDMCMGFGVAFFGHQPSFVIEALTEQLKEGVHVGPQSRHAAEVARLICELTGMERVTFCNSGTEAVMTALRVVRAATGRQRIVTFTGSYHGHSDSTLALAGAPGKGEHTVPMAPGVSPSAIGDTIVLPYGLEKSLDVIEAQAPTLAAVLVEPVQSRRPGLHPAEFLRKVREITRRHNVPLIFDEMITGFRIHPGGSQVDFGVEADIATYGKMIGGGMPLGIVAARGSFLDRIDGGAWRYGDSSYPAVERTFYAGTFCKHPLAMAAARAVLTELKRQGPSLQAGLNERTRQFVTSVNAIFDDEGVPLNLVHYGSLMRFNLSGNFSYLYQPLEMDIFCHHLIDRGVYIWEGRTLFLSTAHTDADLETIRTAVGGAVRDMKAGGFFGDGSDPEPKALTEAQRDLWVMSQLGDDAAKAYQESLAIDVDGSVDSAVLERAATWLAGRHDALRTSISADGQTQIVTTTPLVDCRVTVPSDLRAAMATEASTVISLSTNPLWRVRAWTRPGGRSVIAVYAHHIVVDGWSMGVLLDELSAAYRAMLAGKTPDLPPAPTFGAFLADRDHRLASASARTAREYWQRRLEGTLPALDLPTDAVRPALKTFSATRILRTLSPGLHRRLSTLGAKDGCSLFMTVLAGYVALLHRLSGATDIIVGVPVAGRPAPGDAKVVGFCTHMVPVRVTVEPEQPFSVLLTHVRTAVLDAFDHQEWPFGRILDDLTVEPDLSRTPVFATTFNLDRPLAVSDFAGMPAALTALPVQATAYDLACNVVVNGDDVVVSWDGNSDLWQLETLERWMAHFEALLSSAALEPSTSVARLSWMDATTRAQVESGWNATTESGPEFETLHDWVDAQLRLARSTEVLTCGNERVTGAQLDERARALEASLRERGVGCGDLVGVSVPRSVDLVAALIAVLRTGAAYVPLDPAFPEARLSRMIEHSGVSWIVRGVQGGSLELVQASGGSATGPRRRALRTDPAYVIYTSASTGDPKGVVISHGAVLNLIQTMGRTLAPASSDAWLAVTTVSFDISVLEIFLPLTHGVRLVLADDRDVQDGVALAALLDKESVTFMQATPAGWRLLIESGWHGRRELTMVCGGEALPPALARSLVMAGKALWNVYGPTETTIWSTATGVTNPDRLTIGRPLGNTQLYVMSAHGQLQPPGVPGELWIGGAGLATGYLNDDAATASRFVPNPLGGPSPRVYRTGDLVRWTADGEIEFLGRLDHQVKVRGFRIELGEIEVGMTRVAGVETAVAHVVETPSGERTLAAWYTGTPPEEVVRQHLTSQLPTYMVPAVITRVASLPKTPNGKIDRRALASSLRASASATRTFEAPQSATEQRVAALWSEVLSVSSIGRHDDFLMLGGNSLIAARVATRLGNVTLRELLEHRTVAGLAALLDTRGTTTRVEIVL